MNFKQIAAKIFRLQSPVLDWFVWQVIEHKLSNGYKFSSVQKRWLSTLLAFPERQHRGSLGTRDENGVETFCCLGQAAMLVVDKADYYWTPESQRLALREANDLRSIFLLTEDLRLAYNLLDTNGEFANLATNFEIESLAEMNDNLNFTWTDLAWYVVQNPTNVFECW